MIEVFVRWYPRNELRVCIAQTVMCRLGAIKDIKIDVVMSSLEIEPYHIGSKAYAEQASESPIYCVIDDDQLPISDNFFSLGESLLSSHPEYGMLAGFPLEYGLAGQPYADRKEEVVEAHSIGCPYFVRKGTLSFPDGPLRQYDGILSKVVTDQGLKTGFARHAIYNHLGYGFSQIGYED